MQTKSVLPLALAAFAAAGLFLTPGSKAADEVKSTVATPPPSVAAKPLKALLITGGCCHDYTKQKDILTTGLSARVPAEWTVVHEGGNSTKHKVSIYSQPDWYKGYDVIVHDECFADVKEPDFVKGIVKAQQEGIPAVNLHCAMHCYRTAKDIGKPVAKGTDDSIWFDYLGLQSSGHGPQKPITLTFADKESPILLGQKEWTTINEELYNNIQVYDTAKALIHGKQDDGKEVVVAWTNIYGDKKAKVFSTTLGHNNETVADDRYLDLVANGLLWACDLLDASGKPKAGYGKK